MALPEDDKTSMFSLSIPLTQSLTHNNLFNKFIIILPLGQCLHVLNLVLNFNLCNSHVIKCFKNNNIYSQQILS